MTYNLNVELPMGEYMAEMKKRGKESRVYQAHQLTGLEIAQLLNDNAHKALYIKLAKSHDSQLLRGLAKDISENKNVGNKGAYFMTRLKDIKSKK